MMETNKQEYLIQKYLAKQCSEAELEEVLSLLQTNLGKTVMRQKLNEAMTSADENLIKISPEISAEVEYRIMQTIRQRKLRTSHRVRMRSAAAILFFLISFIIWYQLGPNIKDGILASNQKEVKIENGKIAKFELPDGTLIQAKGGSRLNYANNLNSMSQRRVHLEGEAFFDVKKDKQKPFIIELKKATVEVVGTAFNIKESKTTGEVIVTVTEGTVLLKSRTYATETYIQKQQVGILKPNDSLIILSTNNSANYLNWLSGRLIFDQIPLTIVAQQLERIYDVNIIINDYDLSRLSFTADMKVQKIQTVLEQISTSLNITYDYDYRKKAYVLKKYSH